MNNKYYIPYFTHQELACKTTEKIVLAEGFAEKLVQLREAYGKPMQVTSCCRSRDYNRKVGGSKNSFHIYDFPTYSTGGTCAIDITITDSIARAHLVSTALALSWTIGIHKSFLHLDRRIDYTELKQVVFVY